jgi:hypothetical protein
VDPGPAHQPARRLLALLSAVPAVRPLRRVDPAADDVADPLEQSDDGHRAILDELAGTVEVLLRALRRGHEEQAAR